MLSAYLLAAAIGIMPPVVMKSPRVRPMSQTAREIVADAARRSPTITRLLEIIERSDTIVYIDLDFNLRSEGATTLIASNTLCRFVRVVVGQMLTPHRRIEMLGHELQHAVEIIQAPQVRDASGVRQLFSKIGWLLTDLSYESPAAIGTERQVRKELISSPLRR
jgi:hypothetical protein